MKNIETLIQEVKPTLEQISQKLGEGANFSWEVILKQQYVEGYKHIVALVVNLLLLGGAILAARFGYQKREEAEYNSEKSFGFGVLAWSIVFALLLVTVIGCNIFGIIDNFANPEFQALREVINMLTQSTPR